MGPVADVDAVLERSAPPARTRIRRLETRRRDGVLLFLALALAGLALAPPLAAGQAAVADETPAIVWLDPKGKPLPFASDDELLEFLRTAKVVKRKTIKEGINHTEKVLLEKDGVQANACFREVDRELKRTRIDGRYYLRFVDHYAHDVATYELARRLGLRNVPPAVLRKLGRTPGSVQIWVEGATNKPAKDLRPPSPIAYVKQVWDRSLFDNLILNVDRNPQNILVGEDFTLWLIDHGRAFQPQGELLSAELLKMVNRKIWDRLEAMSDEELMDVVREYVDAQQLNALVERRKLLQARVQDLVAESGEDKVFY
jgi:hypothetical protein